MRYSGLGRILGAGSLTVALGGCVLAPPVAQDGVVLAAVPADQPGNNTGAGAVVGAVLLGGAGGAVGSGLGKALAVTAGVIAGASAGTAAEAAHQPRGGVAYTVQLSDDQVITIIQHLDAGEQAFPAGSKVTVETTGAEQRVVPLQF